MGKATLECCEPPQGACLSHNHVHWAAWLWLQHCDTLQNPAPGSWGSVALFSRTATFHRGKWKELKKGSDLTMVGQYYHIATDHPESGSVQTSGSSRQAGAVGCLLLTGSCGLWADMDREGEGRGASDLNWAVRLMEEIRIKSSGTKLSLGEDTSSDPNSREVETRGFLGLDGQPL